MAQADREIELKLELAPADVQRLRSHPLLGEAIGSAHLLSIYFDTPDGTLRKAGFTLRVRSAKGRFVQTVKQDSGEAAGLFNRPEWEVNLDRPEPDLDRAADTPLGKVLNKKTRKKLAPLVQSEMTRTTWQLGDDESRFEVTLDEGEVRGGKAAQQIAELELELTKGEPSALIGFARELGQQVPVRLGVLTKAERGWALAEGTLARAAKASRIELDEGMSVAAGFAAIAASCLKQFRHNEDLVLAARDPAAVHRSTWRCPQPRRAPEANRPSLGRAALRARDRAGAGLRPGSGCAGLPAAARADARPDRLGANGCLADK
jgi:inorganic triphosphatase YgiF